MLENVTWLLPYILQKKCLALSQNSYLYSFLLHMIYFQMPKLQVIDWIMIERIMLSEPPSSPTPDLEKHPIKLNYNKVPSDRAKIQIYFRLCSCRKRVACCLEFLLNETVCVSPCLCHPPIPLIRVKSIITRKLLAYSLQIIMDKLKFQYSEIRDFFSWDSFSFAQRNQYFDKLGA